MTTITCGLTECRAWLNGRCNRRTVKVVGMRCLDFTRRKGSYRSTTTTVLCTNEGCSRFSFGKCTVTVLRMKGDGCEPISNEGGEHGEGRRNEGGRQVPIRY